MGEPACAHLRAAECEALKALSPIASKAFIAIRFGRREAVPFEAGVRDFEAWGISKDQAARALAELIAAGLLEVVREAGFGAKRVRRVLRIVHTRQEAGQSQERDNAPAGSRKGATVIPIQSRQRDYGTPLQSRWRDIPKEPSSPSAQKAEGEEGSPPAAPPREGGAPAGSREDLKEKIRRASEGAKERGLALWRLVAEAGDVAQSAGLKVALERGREAAVPPPNDSLPFVGTIAA
jgi:hypothetical protein